MTKPVLIAAVSGGVDSVVMLERLVATAQYELVVAHVDHGMRSDSGQDEAFVAQLASTYGLAYESTKLDMGRRTSEDKARSERYEFLWRVARQHEAQAVATAHHLDDVVETLLINLRRGTGWRGLCSIRETDDIKRPLLDWRKSEVVAYAIESDLSWREDSTNDDLTYTRNLIRQFYLPNLSAGQFDELIRLWRQQCQLRNPIDELVAPLSGNQELDRRFVRSLDEAVAREVLRAWLGKNYQSATFRRLIDFNRTVTAGKRFNLPGNKFIRSTRQSLVANW